MSWGRPKCASIRLPSRTSRTTCASVSIGRRLPLRLDRPRPGAAAREGLDGVLLGPVVLATTSSSRTV
jgi:hypothetical protein